MIDSYLQTLEVTMGLPGYERSEGLISDGIYTRICIKVPCTLKQRARWKKEAARQGCPSLDAYIVKLLDREGHQ